MARLYVYACWPYTLNHVITTAIFGKLNYYGNQLLSSKTISWNIVLPVSSSIFSEASSFHYSILRNDSGFFFHGFIFFSFFIFSIFFNLESTILSLYGRIRISENAYFRNFYAVTSCPVFPIDFKIFLFKLKWPVF